VIVRVDAVTICGADLHILHGNLPTLEAGRVLGHEAVGTIDAIGSGVHALDIVSASSCPAFSACGRCRFCRQGRFGQCLGGGGWILGNQIDGVHAERVRVPFADRSVHPLPDSISDESAVMLADILPTSYEVGCTGRKRETRDVVVIVGAGTIRPCSTGHCPLVQPQQDRPARPRRSSS
jgi:alcohol dehydrogenase